MLPETGKNSAIVFPKVKSTERKGKVLKCNRLRLRSIVLAAEISINTMMYATIYSIYDLKKNKMWNENNPHDDATMNKGEIGFILKQIIQLVFF